MDKVKVIISNEQKKVKIPTGIRILLRRCCNAVAKIEGLSGEYEVNITFVDNEKIKEINAKYRKIDEVTDVLSFPMGENGEYPENPETNFKMLGDVIISAERAFVHAEEYDHTVRRELGYLTTHSMLHLLGYDHVNGGIEATNMREKEEEVMNLVGQPRDLT